MIIGIGNDIVECSRIRQLLDSHKESFLKHFLTDAERKEGNGRPDYCAGRWAAKEAVAKALGCGFGSRCAVTDIEVLHNPSGRPVVKLSGAGAATMQSLGGNRIHLTITHEKEYAFATAILEKTGPDDSADAKKNQGAENV